MSADPALRIAVTVLATAVAALYALDLDRRHSGRTRLNAAIHVIMAAAMTAMMWPFGLRIPPIAGAGGFCAAAAVYAYQALVPARTHSSEGLEDHGHRGPLLWYHCAMMAAMAWMYTAMSLSMGFPVPPREPMAMPSGLGRASAGSPASGEQMGTAGLSRGLSGLPALVSWACLILFVVASVAFAGLLVRSLTRSRPAREARRSAASLGMAAIMLAGFGLLVLP